MRIFALSNFLLLILLQAACARSPSPEAISVLIPTLTPTPAPRNFDGTHAFQYYLVEQMKLGPRPAGSAANRATGDFILAQLRILNWKTEMQEFAYRNVSVRNIIGKTAQSRGPIIILGAHYDTRLRADQDKQHADQPVPGANDGASGVAVLLELARTLDVSKLRNEVWLAFFDAEDDGGLDSWPWSVGATYLAENLNSKPEAVVIVDMVGDADQNIYYEQNSDAQLQQQLWAIAARLGYASEFIPQYKWSMEADHTPFLQRGIRAVDIIDFDYLYWHTTQDTTDKVSALSLGRVGNVLQVWLEGQ
jgi:Zn-dependent M28 family amino/carboxypeptidase